VGLTPRPAQPGFFAYLSAEASGLEQLLDGLARAGCPGRAYVRGATPAQRQRWRRPGLEVLDGPPPLAEALARATAVVHHAGAGMAQHALSAGLPQLLFPTHLEQVLNAQLLHGLEVGQYLIDPFPAAVVAQELQQLLNGRHLAARARALALQARGPWDPLPRIVERCLALLGQETLTFSPRVGSPS
jgi:hypothetical protein